MNGQLFASLEARLAPFRRVVRLLRPPAFWAKVKVRSGCASTSQLMPKLRGAEVVALALHQPRKFVSRGALHGSRQSRLERALVQCAGPFSFAPPVEQAGHPVDFERTFGARLNRFRLGQCAKYPSGERR